MRGVLLVVECRVLFRLARCVLMNAVLSSINRTGPPRRRSIEERKDEATHTSKSEQRTHKSNTSTPVLPRETQGINQRLEAFSFSLKNPSR